MFRIANINKNRSLGKDSQRGFTIIELIIVVAVLGILIPITATLVINSYSYYSDILNMNKLSLSADNALRSITNDIRLMEGFQSADDDNLHFTLADGEDRYYRFDSETFQMCKENWITVIIRYVSTYMTVFANTVYFHISKLLLLIGFFKVSNL